MKRWAYYRMHIPGVSTVCKCASQEVLVEKCYTSQDMDERTFYKWLARLNYTGQGHWQYWD